jgi:hypothetical protein
VRIRNGPRERAEIERRRSPLSKQEQPGVMLAIDGRTVVPVNAHPSLGTLRCTEIFSCKYLEPKWLWPEREQTKERQKKEDLESSSTLQRHKAHYAVARKRRTKRELRNSLEM